jgi:trimeric autotransporter adhesin
MKKYFLIVTLMLAAFVSFPSLGQAPQSFKYQSVARDNAGLQLVSKSIGLRIRIHDQTATGAVVYSETHAATTNAFGVFTISVGGGAVVSGTFSSIDWGSGSKFIEVEADFNGGASYTSMGASQLLSVPYALYSSNGGVAGPAGPAGPTGPAGAMGATGPQGAQGIQGVAGTAGANGRNVLSGSGNPSAGIGANGEFYINTVANTLHGPKAGGAWPPNGISLVGPGGAAGVSGTDGLNILNGVSTPPPALGVIGEFYIRTATNTLFGPKTGAGWGSGISLVGPAGADGSANGWGLTGATGTIAGTNFIGTTDAQSFDIRTNNILRTRITTKGQIETYNTGQSVFIGEGAGAADDLTLNQNVFIGFMVGAANTTGNSNTAIGRTALSSNTTGSGNTATGWEALTSNTTGIWNTAIGLEALRYNTTGSDNAATGRYALQSNTTGNSNTANGVSALRANTTGNFNAATGRDALGSNTTGNSNTANGWGALFSNTTGSSNTANGDDALGSNTTGYSNTANGTSSLKRNSTGYANTADGVDAISRNTTGNYNAALGNLAGRDILTGSNNIAIGYNAQVPDGTADNQVRIGNIDVSYAGIQVAWTITSDRRWKSAITESNLGLDFISKLKPVSYLRINDENKKREYGFIAQELEATLLESGVSNNGIISRDDKGMLSVRYNDLMAPMVKAMQEQQEMIEKLKAEVALLKTQHQSVTGKLETENQLLKSDYDNRLKKIEEMLNVKAQK